MDQNVYVFGVPALVGVLGIYGWWSYQRTIAKSDEAKTKAEAASALEEANHRRDVHESFKLLGMKLDNESDKRELLKDELFATKLKMAELVGREEMTAFTIDLSNRFDKLRVDVMNVLHEKG